MLTASDLDLFASYVTVAAAEEMTQHLDHGDLLVLNSRGKASANLLFRKRENAIATRHALSVKLGITPSARARLRVASPKPRYPKVRDRAGSGASIRCCQVRSPGPRRPLFSAASASRC